MIERTDNDKKDMKKHIHCHTKSDIEDKMNTMIKNMTNGEDSLKKLYDIYHVKRSSRQSNINK